MEVNVAELFTQSKWFTVVINIMPKIWCIAQILYWEYSFKRYLMITFIKRMAIKLYHAWLCLSGFRVKLTATVSPSDQTKAPWQLSWFTLKVVKTSTLLSVKLPLWLSMCVCVCVYQCSHALCLHCFFFVFFWEFPARVFLRLADDRYPTKDAWH